MPASKIDAVFETVFEATQAEGAEGAKLEKSALKAISTATPQQLDYQDPDSAATALMMTITFENKTLFDALLKAGADVNVVSIEERTALDEAQDPEMIKALLAHGARPYAEPGIILHARCGNIEELRAAIASGADVNAKDDPLHFGSALAAACTQTSAYDIVLLLLQSGADVNAADSAGMTPLMLAAQASDTEVVQLLLHYNADITKKDVLNTTAADIAREYGKDTLAQIIENRAGVAPALQEDFNKQARADAAALLNSALDAGKNLLNLFRGKGGNKPKNP